MSAVNSRRNFGGMLTVDFGENWCVRFDPPEIVMACLSSNIIVFCILVEVLMRCSSEMFMQFDKLLSTSS